MPFHIPKPADTGRYGHVHALAIDGKSDGLLSPQFYSYERLAQPWKDFCTPAQFLGYQIVHR